MCLVVDSLRGSVKQPRGFGSQHFATVNVTGLQTDRGQTDRGQTDRETGSSSSISIISSIISTCSRLHVRRTRSEVIVGVQTDRHSTKTQQRLGSDGYNICHQQQTNLYETNKLT